MAQLLQLFISTCDFEIPVVNKIKNVLTRKYGKDWATHGYRQYDHEKEEFIKSVKVKLTKKDLQAAKPTKVTKRKCIDNILLSLDTLIKKIPISQPSKNDSKECELQIYNNKIPVYVINCDIHKKRINKFRKYANKAKLSICRELCVNGRNFDKKIICSMIKNNLVAKKADLTSIEIAIFYSHINALQRFVNSRKKYGLILEDDAQVNVNFKNMLKQTLKALKSYNFEHHTSGLAVTLLDFLPGVLGAAACV